jgi:UDP-N-acetylmuramoyl-tripeptide--D-alanyl-D-alanine ligase
MIAPLWTAQEIALATAGRMTRAFDCTGISIDSRSVQPGDLFVAIGGERFDGHRFVAQALRAGAAGALVARQPDDVPADAPLVVDGDTLEALRALARGARARSDARIIAVTGSVGKTGTKEMLIAAFGAQGPTHGSAGNLNNHIGLPLSLARLPRDAAYAVLEMGMNHPGEIAPLSALARPHIAIITTVEAVHIEAFASVAAIADEKAAIFSGLEAGGIAVLNRDNPHYERLADHARAAGAEHVVSFGQHDQADARLVNVALHGSCSCVAADILGQAITYKIGLPGRHWVMNSLAVLAAVRLAGADMGMAGLALASLDAPAGRGRRHHVAAGEATWELVDDSYNASPASMRAAFQVLAAARPGPRGRRIAVLGDMLELGDDAAAMHADLAGDIDAAQVDRVLTAGPLMRHLHDALLSNRQGPHVAKVADLLPVLLADVRAGDVVLVKGSHGSGMWKLVEALLAEDAPRRAVGAK